MITTNPEFNKPVECVCAKCGRKFVKSPWTGYSTNKIKLYKHYTPKPYESSWPDSMARTVVLCESCAAEELKAGNVSQVMY